MLALAQVSVAGVRAKMVHFVIRADTTIVRVDANWVFDNNAPSDANSEQVCVSLPKDATDIVSEDTGATSVDAEAGKICTKVAGETVMTYAYSVKNQNGICDMSFDMPVETDTAMIFVAGTNTEIHNDIFERDAEVEKQSPYAAVYSAKALKAGLIRLGVSGLPVQYDAKKYKVAAVVGTGSIILMAVLTILFEKMNIRKANTKNTK